MAQLNLNSYVRGELPTSSGLQSQCSRPDQFDPNEVFIPAHCAIHKRAFFTLVLADKGAWKLVAAVIPGPESGKGGTSVFCRARVVDAVKLTGSLLISAEYSGCPCCGDDSLIRCGCGQFSCGGAVRGHGDHQDHLCGSCDRWSCLRSKDGIRDFQAFADASLLPPRPEFAPELQASEPAGRKLQSRSERKMLPPTSEIQRRR
jgi:hypothetical protein